MRYARYLRYEKNIAASDKGGILERWSYGPRLLEDDTATTPAGNLRHGVLAKLVGNAQRAVTGSRSARSSAGFNVAGPTRLRPESATRWRIWRPGTTWPRPTSRPPSRARRRAVRSA